MSNYKDLSKKEYKIVNNLFNDICNLNRQLSEIENGTWVTIITPKTEDTMYYSDRFEEELTEWMKLKIKEYKKEFYKLLYK